MRKTIILAAAVEVLAVVAVVTSLIRTDAGTSNRQVAPAPATQEVQTAGIQQTVHIPDAI